METATWIAKQLSAGKSVAHTSGLKAYLRFGAGRVTSYGVTTARGMKYDFATAKQAAIFAASHMENS